MVDFDADPRLLAEHNLGGPATLVGGYLQLIRDGDLDLVDALPALVAATLALSIELARLGEIYRDRLSAGPAG